jgi:hypothetical protein
VFWADSNRPGWHESPNRQKNQERRKTVKHESIGSYLTILALSAALVLLLSSYAVAGGSSLKYEVTITNITKGQILSPAVVASHQPGLDPIFKLGEPASPEFASVAEDAVLDPLISNLRKNPMVNEVGTLFGVNGPILPGETSSITLDAGDGLRLTRISLAGMLVTTNDGFYGLNAAGGNLPGNLGNPDQTEVCLVPTYDAGSERNSESCSYIPGPPCGNHSHDPAPAEGFVHIHSGIHGAGDLDPAEVDWLNPAAKITIRLIHADLSR